MAWLCLGATRGVLSKPPAEARLHQHRGGLAARTFKVRDHRVRLPQRAARALSASWSIGRPPTEHAPRNAHLAWLCCGATRGALLAKPPAGARLHHHCDRSTARVSVGPTTAFESYGARLHCFSANSPQSTRHTVWTCRDCVVADHGTRSSPSRRLWFDCNNTAASSRHGLRTFPDIQFGSMASGPRALRLVKYRSTAHRARAVQCGFGIIVLWRNARRAPRQPACWGSTALSL